MEDWPKGFFDVLETAVSEVENFFNDMTEELTELVDELTKFSNSVAEEMETNFLNELDEFFSLFFEPISENGSQNGENEVNYYVTYVEPTATEHPTCQGCRHYHGQAYGGNLLVCGMHPYGVETETCPDREPF